MENTELTNRPEPEHVVPKKNDVFGFTEDDTEQKELEFEHWIYGSMAQKQRDTDRRLSASTSTHGCHTLFEEFKKITTAYYIAMDIGVAKITSPNCIAWQLN